jgi:hypothetical protein
MINYNIYGDDGDEVIGGCLECGGVCGEGGVATLPAKEVVPVPKEIHKDVNVDSLKDALSTDLFSKLRKNSRSGVIRRITPSQKVGSGLQFI